jgi:hypothetical protein
MALAIYLLVCLTSRPNPATGTDTTLRVDTCVSVGGYRTVCIWRNRSAGRVGLREASSLYDKWQEVCRKTKAKAKGSFSLDSEFRLSAVQNKHVESEETIVLSHAASGKWTNQATPAISSSRLYAWTAGEEQSSYVISALTLSPVPGTPSWMAVDSLPRAAPATVRSI